DVGEQDACIGDAKRLKDALLGLDAGRCRAGDDGRVAEFSAKLAEAAVHWSKILAPSIDDVRLVDDEERGAVFEKPGDLLGLDSLSEALGCHVDHRPRALFEHLIARV